MVFAGRIIAPFAGQFWDRPTDAMLPPRGEDRRWQECRRGTHECVRHNGFNKLRRRPKTKWHCVMWGGARAESKGAYWLLARPIHHLCIVRILKSPLSERALKTGVRSRSAEVAGALVPHELFQGAGFGSRFLAH